MPTNLLQKKEIVSDLTKKIKEAKIIIFVNFSTLKVGDLTGLRKQIRSAGGEIFIAKKTLFLRALGDASGKDLLGKDSLVGEVAFVFGYQDEIEIPKLLARFAKKIQAVKVLTGIMGEQVLAANDVLVLASLPERPVLLVQLLRVMQAPIRNFELIFKIE